MTDSSTLPFEKRVFFMWLQGLQDAPPIVRICYRSWVERNPDWEVVVLTERNLCEYVDIPRWASEKLSRTHLSDLVRLRLLETWGGVWADSTTLCNWPLDEWLPQAVGSGFFAFCSPARGYLLSNWFLASEVRNPLVVETRALLESYWEKARLQPPGPLRDVVGKVLVRLLRVSVRTTALWMSRPVRDWLKVYPYFAFHYAFALATRATPGCRETWRETFKMSADGPHLVQRFGMERPVDFLMLLELSDPTTPMYKLSWKEVAGLVSGSSALSTAIRLSGFDAQA